MTQGITDRDARASVYLSARIEREDREIEVRVRNASASGAMLESSPLMFVRQGDVGIFRKGKVEVEYEVMWIGKGVYGVRFASRIRTADLMPAPTKRRDVILDRPAMDCRRPALR